MTKKFNVYYTCQHCGKRSTAETGFGRWMRNCEALDSVNGIVRTDTDHWILRYKTYLDGRDFQLLMAVEVKEHDTEPDPSQTDILSFIRQSLDRKQLTMNQRLKKLPISKGGFSTIKVKSMMTNRWINLRFYGVHLLQFEKTSPKDSVWIKWDRKEITENVLVGVLAMERRPDNPQKFMIEYLRDRHRKDRLLPLISK